MDETIESENTLKQYKESMQMLLDSHSNKIETQKNTIDNLIEEKELIIDVLRQIAFLVIEMEDFAEEELHDSERLGNMVTLQARSQKVKAEAFTEITTELRRVLRPVRDL